MKTMSNFKRIVKLIMKNAKFAPTLVATNATIEQSMLRTHVFIVIRMMMNAVERILSK